MSSFGVQPEWDFTSYQLMWNPMPCAICGLPTHWAELNFQAPLHPGPCDVKMWGEYFEANRQADARSGRVTDWEPENGHG